VASRWQLWLGAVQSSWRVALLALACGVVLWGVSYFYLVPAMDGLQGATVAQKRMIKAVSSLLMALLLAMLALGVWFTLRRRQ